MALNIAERLRQGLDIGRGIKESRRTNEIQGLQSALGGQIQQGGFEPSNSLDFQQLMALDPVKAQQMMTTFQSLDKNRLKAYHQDMQGLLRKVESGDIEGASNLLSDRLKDISNLKGDPSGTQMLQGMLNEGRFEELVTKLRPVEQIGIANGDLPDTELRQAKLDKARGELGTVSVQSSKIMDDGTVIEVLKGGGRQVISNTGEILTGDEARNAVSISRDQAFNRKKELARLSQTIEREQLKEKLLSDQQRAIQSGNIKRLGTLSNTSSGRNSAVKKATKFKLALEKGEAFSGAGRKGASFIPGVFTSQGQFDEEFNAFSEVAARQQLKASGETRPTDADVQGMKQAMFGIGRDETVNIQLLTDFIVDQNAQNSELDQLIDASRGGSLSSFTFTPQPAAQAVQAAPIPRAATELTDEELAAELAALQGGL